MRLHEITLRNFRGVVDQTIHFADGVTIVEGPNEVGKSSIAEALHVLRTYKHTSTHRDVRALQPVGRDVGPEVSVRLSTGPHELTYRKQWLKEASAELHVSGQQPQQLTGDEAHQAYERILAETVDLDLLAALEVQQGESLAQASLAELRSLQNALDDEGTADDGDDVLLERMDEEYLRYFTPKGRRLGFRDQARTEVAELEAQVADLEGRSERMDQLTAQYERQVQAQHDAEQRLARARNEFDAQRDRQAELHELERVLDEAARAAEDAGHRLERAREQRAARRQAVEDLTRREEELRNQRAALDDARQRHDALQQASEEARAANDEAQATRSDGLTTIRRLQRAVHTLRDAETHRRLARTLADARAAADEHRAAQARLDATTVGEDELDELRALEAELRTALATRDAAAPVVDVTPLGEATVLLDGAPVGATEGHVVQTPTRILVEDVVSVEVRPGTAPDALVERVHAARETLDTRCAELGVADIAEAKAVAAERREAGRRLESSRSTLAGLLGDESFDDAERRLATLAAGLDDELPDEPLEALELQLREAEEAEPTSEAAAEEARRQFEAARERAEQTGGEVIRMTQAVETLEEVVTELRSSLERAQETASDEALDEACAAAEQEARTRDSARDAAEAALSGEDAETLRILLDNASAGLDEATEAISRARDDVAGTKALLDDRAAEGIYDQLVSARAQLEAQRSEVDRTERRAAAAALLHDVVHRHRDDAHLAYLEPFRRHIQRLGRVIFGHDFDVEIGPDLRIEARVLDGRRVPFDHLSGGAKEQLALLGRLATAQLVDPAEGAPLILDDALGFTDPDRLHALSAVLNDVGGQAQIVLLTCQPSRYATLGRARRVRL